MVVDWHYDYRPPREGDYIVRLDFIDDEARFCAYMDQYGSWWYMMRRRHKVKAYRIHDRVVAWTEMPW
jgi:hypothetical protein